MRFALENKEKVVISTATITLQQQLFEKDIPLVSDAMGDAKFKAVIMKGRGNYLCRRRLDDALKEPDLFDQEDDEIRRIAEWAERTASGVRSELSFQPSETVWQTVCSESDMCGGMHCPWRESCFVFALRKEAASAHIIVVNHHLLFADLAARYQGAGYENAVVLPPFNRLIIDEAHTIENAATSFFSAEFGRTGIFRQISRLYHKRRGSPRGLLIRLCALLPANEDPVDGMVAALEKIRSRAEELDSCALELCGQEGVLRLSPAQDKAPQRETQQEIFQAALFPAFKALRKNILGFTAIVREVTDSLDEEAGTNAVVWEIKSILKRFEEIAQICADFPEYLKRENDVLWIERQRTVKEPWAVFTKSPLDIAPML
jgi:ATP-dependent DNA helicase DinG